VSAAGSLMRRPRVIARGQNDPVYLVETRVDDRGLRLGVVYDASTGELFPEFWIEILARGYWRETDPNEHRGVGEKVRVRLTDP
jgi:hypothetical protein